VAIVFCDEIWTVGPQPVLCAERYVCWRAILLEGEPDSQPAIGLKGRYKQNKLLFVKASL